MGSGFHFKFMIFCKSHVKDSKLIVHYKQYYTQQQLFNYLII